VMVLEALNLLLGRVESWLSVRIGREEYGGGRIVVLMSMGVVRVI
jgi:hypothetical protein